MKGAGSEPIQKNVSKEKERQGEVYSVRAQGHGVTAFGKPIV